jgi:hypothetical protein
MQSYKKVCTALTYISDLFGLHTMYCYYIRIGKVYIINIKNKNQKQVGCLQKHTGNLSFTYLLYHEGYQQNYN